MAAMERTRLYRRMAALRFKPFDPLEKLLGRGILFQKIVGWGKPTSCCAGKDTEVFGFPSNSVWVMYIDIVVQGLVPGPSATPVLSRHSCLGFNGTLI
jgi:hypothetical protein